MTEDNRVKILLIPPSMNRSVLKAIEDVKEYADIKLIPVHDLYRVSNLQNHVDWADIILMDGMTSSPSLVELDY